MKLKTSTSLGILDFIFFAAMIFSGGTVYVATAGMKQLRYVFFIVGIMVFIGYYFLSKNENIKLRRLLFYKPICYYAIYALMLFIFNYLAFRVGIFQRLVTLLIVPIIIMIYCYFLNALKRRNKALLIFNNMVLVLAIVSLLFWFISELGIYPNPHSMYLIDWGGIHGAWSYFNIHFIAQGFLPFFGLNIIRNTGIFAEAPMYSFLLSVALIFNLFYLNKTKYFKIRTTILTFTILTTLSTTGMIIVVLAFLGFEVNKHQALIKKLPTKKLVAAISTVSAIIVLIFGILMFEKMKSPGVSVGIRTDDFIAGLKTFIHRPLFGNGIGNYAAIRDNMMHSRLGKNGNSGFSLGALLVLAYGGIMYFVLYLIPLVFSIIKKSYREIFVSILFLILFVLTIVNDLPLFIFAIVFVFYIVLFKGEKVND